MSPQSPLGPGRGQQGMALLITLITLSVLFIVTVQFHRTMWQDYQSARLTQTRQQLRSVAESGINTALAILDSPKQKNEVDSFFSPWNQQEITSFLDFKNGSKLELKINDQAAKIPINGLVADEKETSDRARHYHDTLRSILMSETFEMEESQAESLIAAIIDWIDKDEDPSDDGAEQSYYDAQSPRHLVPNNWINDLSELLGVRDISPTLLYGIPNEKEGLSTYISASGTSRGININTAPPALLSYIFPQLNDFLLDSIVEYREDKDNLEVLEKIDWYKRISNWPSNIVLKEDYLTTKSSFFSITALATYQSFHYRITATAERLEDGTIHISNRRTTF